MGKEHSLVVNVKLLWFAFQNLAYCFALRRLIVFVLRDIKQHITIMGHFFNDSKMKNNLATYFSLN